MSSLEDQLPGMYREMHAAGAFQGLSWEPHLRDLKNFLSFRESGRILDYGCGPLGGLAKHYGQGVVAYDPFVEKFAADPWKQDFTTFFSCDVMEHLTLEQLHQLMRRLCKVEKIRFLFIVLSTRPANKLLPNGLNAHLTIRTAQWWKGFFDASLGLHFAPEVEKADLIHDEALFAWARLGHNREALRGE